jgi:hypothetical protein
MFEYEDRFNRLTDLFCQGYTVFLQRLELESEDEDDGYWYKSFIKSLKTARANMPNGSSGLFIVSIDSKSDLPDYFREEFVPIMLDGEEAVVVPVAEIAGSEELQRESNIQPKTEDTIKLKLVENGSMVFWEDKLLPTVKGKDFDILHKLASTPGMIVTHEDLYKFIDSDENVDELLRQRIHYIRNSFPPPFSDCKRPQAIIKTKRQEGYYLNLAEKQVETIE